MTEQQPMGTASMQGYVPAQRTAEEDAAERERLNKQLYDFRKTADPLLYERVIRYHPHANASDESFGVFTADYDRLAGEVLPPPETEGGLAAGQPQPAPYR